MRSAGNSFRCSSIRSIVHIVSDGNKHILDGALRWVMAAAARAKLPLRIFSERARSPRCIVPGPRNVSPS
jgi:hypothetical protein